MFSCTKIQMILQCNKNEQVTRYPISLQFNKNEEVVRYLVLHTNTSVVSLIFSSIQNSILICVRSYVPAHVHNMLRVLTPKIKECRESLSIQAVGNALYGLQSMSMSSDCTEVRDVLRVLVLATKI